MKLPRRNKYNAIKVDADGYTFDSKAEHKRYCELKLLFRARAISQLAVHPAFVVGCGIRYIADFSYYREGENPGFVVEDVKSTATAKSAVFRLKAKLFHEKHGFHVTIIMSGKTKRGKL